MGGEDRIENETTLVADPVAMGMRQFVNQPVSAEHSELAADGSRAAAFFGGCGGGLIIQQLL